MPFGYYLLFHPHISINIKSNETQGFPDNKRVNSLHKPHTFNYYLFISHPHARISLGCKSNWVHLLKQHAIKATVSQNYRLFILCRVYTNKQIKIRTWYIKGSNKLYTL